jgi:regulator of protease activity HflC (stomatin/prohibitin superfamily)
MYKLIELLTLGLFQLCIVRQGEVRVIERRGRFSRVAGPGVNLLVSLWGAGEVVGRFNISQVVRDANGRSIIQPRTGVEVISMRMQVDDYPSESVITRDKATVQIDAVVYYRITEPDKAVYNVSDYASALQKLVQSALRDECGKYELDDLLTSRDAINNALRVTLDEATDPWGIKVDRVELKDIDLGEFGRILAEQRAAETRRRTEITDAEGAKRAAVLRAEGHAESAVRAAEGEKQAVILRAQAERESTILRAQADREATILHADAEANSILKVRQAEAQGFAMLKQVLNGQHSDEVLRVLELQTAAQTGQKLADGQATKFFLPAELNNLFGFATPRRKDQ